jgi:hypothetical protein
MVPVIVVKITADRNTSWLFCGVLPVIFILSMCCDTTIMAIILRTRKRYLCQKKTENILKQLRIIIVILLSKKEM